MISAERTYAMLGNQPLWEAAKIVHRSLSDAEIPHAILGGVAVCLHGYQRNTVDIDLLLRPGDAKAVRLALEEKEFRTPSGIDIQVLLAGDRAGRDSEVDLPDPSDERVVTQVEGLPVLTLAALIETKLACGSGNPRRTHKDYADVVELIARHKLGSSFARHLHKSLRATFRELVRHARGEA